MPCQHGIRTACYQQSGQSYAIVTFTMVFPMEYVGKSHSFDIEHGISNYNNSIILPDKHLHLSSHTIQAMRKKIRLALTWMMKISVVRSLQVIMVIVKMWSTRNLELRPLEVIMWSAGNLEVMMVKKWNVRSLEVIVIKM